MQITLGSNNMSITLKSDGETPEDAVNLAEKSISWLFDQSIKLAIIDDEEDDNIYIESDQPKDHVLHDGM